MARRPLTQQVNETRERMGKLSGLAEHFGSWRPQAEVLREVESVPTIFPAYDRALGVGGHPTSRLVVVHAPSNEGKSTLALGLGRSFLLRGNFFGFADAERTTPQAYVREMMQETADYDAFMALPVGFYEQVRVEVRKFCETISTLREKGHVPKSTTGLVVVDSVRKLVPEKLWDSLSKELKKTVETNDAKRATKFGKKDKKSGIDGANGRAGQIKAAMNAAWVDELIPLLHDHRISMLLIARETTEEGEGFFADEIVKVGGGAAINYDASLRLRCGRSFVYEATSGDDKKQLVGERITVEVQKTKIHGKTERVPTGFFHTSNGIAAPVGFDLARDLLVIGCDLGLIEQAGSSYRYSGKSLGMGAVNAHRTLVKDKALCAEIELKVRAEQ